MDGSVMDGSVMGGSVLALTFAVDRTHAQYAGELPQQEILRLARQGHGQFGTCEDYIRNTVQHLRALNIHDSRLEDLVSGLDGTRQAER
jgi:cation transport protein ChaC